MACTNSSEEKKIYSVYGIGPYQKISLSQINDSIMQTGKKLFDKNCSSCHTMEYKNSGPDLSNILERRTPEWIMNYMMNLDEMKLKDSISVNLDKKYNSNCKIIIKNENEAFSILEYFRIYQIWLHEFNIK